MTMALNRAVRIGIVGLMYGRYGLLPGIVDRPDANVVALCARRIEAAQELARLHGIEQTYDDWRRMLDEARLDMVMVAVDPATSGPICEYALQHGIAVFAEKLPSHDIECTRRLAKLAADAAVPSCIDYIFPELHTFRAARELIRAGELGNLRLVELDWIFESYDHRNALQTWKTDPAQGGGLLRHFLVHSLHYLEWLFGRIESVSGTLRPSAQRPQSDAHATLLLETCSGVNISVVASNALSYEQRHRLSVWGDRGFLRLSNCGTDPIWDFELSANAESAEPVLLKEKERMQLTAALDSRVEPSARLSAALIERLRSGVKNDAPDLSAALRAHELIEAITESNKNGRTIHVG